MQEFCDVNESTLAELGKKKELDRLKTHINHRTTIENIEEMFGKAGFRVTKVHQETFSMRFMDGSVLLGKRISVRLCSKQEEMLVNLHMADSNRCALRKGSLDVDTIIMVLYLIGCNQEGIFVTPEPLGLGGDPFRLCMVDRTKSYLTNWYS